MPRFVLLRHELPPSASRESHWDLMLEQDESLRTWALLSDPRVSDTVQATVLANHRMDYLDYEGPVSQNRGQVRRVDAGTFRWIQQSETLVEVEFAGALLRGPAHWQDTRGCWRFQTPVNAD